MQIYPKKRTGLCVGVYSGDRILFQGPQDKQEGGFKQKILHLIGVVAPRYDAISGKDEKYAYVSREYLRKKLIGLNVQFIIEKTVNEIELGYIIYDGKDIIIDLLKHGYVKLRGQKIQCEHFNQYKIAQDHAYENKLGLWSDENNNRNSYRYLQSNNKQKLSKLLKQPFKAIVQQINPSKAKLYYQKQSLLFTINFSEVQVVVLSEKNQGQNKNNVRVIRSILESIFLHREVQIYLQDCSQDEVLGYFLNENKQDIRKILLKNGFAKLSKNAIETLKGQQFIILKKIAQIALQEKKGLWKQQKINKKQPIDKKIYQAIIIEINSGDSITVMNVKTLEYQRIFLPNVRSPTQNQSYYYESKQYLRKRYIGQKVKVEIEFNKKINIKKYENQIEEIKIFTFATIFIENINLSINLLENGLITIQNPKIQQDLSKYFEDLKIAEQKGRKNKKGLHSNQIDKSIIFNDLSGGKDKKIDSMKCKNMFALLKNNMYLSAVVQLVLNGSRFKIRLNTQKIIILAVIDGIRCLPNHDQYQQASQEALQYSKRNINQRDIEISLNKVDNKGIFHATIIMNKKNYGVQLLEKGYAICMTGYKYKNQEYLQAQVYARKNKIGLWQYNLNIAAIKGQNQQKYKEVQFTIQGILIEVIGTEQLYIENENCKRQTFSQNAALATNLKVGGLYLAKFTDNIYYRAKIVKQINKQKYQVHYIDFGNYAIIASNHFGLLNEAQKIMKSPIYKVSLYGIDGITSQGLYIIQDYLGTILKIEFKQQLQQDNNNESKVYKVILWNKDICINLELIQYGQASCICNEIQWIKVQEKAKNKRLGKWLNYDQ